MPLRVLICDDSSMARKQMARALPKDWNVEFTFAANGAEGIEAIKAGRAELVFLDLNMPVADGYSVLEAIRRLDLPVLAIAVSGDIQPAAYTRVMALGALAFVKKPVSPDEIVSVLHRYGIRADTTGAATGPELHVDPYDSYHEVANVAMGRAADLLARLLDTFIGVRAPAVSMMALTDVRAALRQTHDGRILSAVSQGFIGGGVRGEALLILDESHLGDIASLVKYHGPIDPAAQMEMLMDLSAILIGATLNGIGEQLDIGFSPSHPFLIGRHAGVDDLLRGDIHRLGRCLVMDMGYIIEERGIRCNVLLLFTEDSLDAFSSLVSYLAA